MAIARSKNDSRNKWLYMIAALVFVAIAVGGYFGYKEYTDLKNENQRLSNPEEAAKTDIENTKTAVAAIIEVPTGEEPTIANVVDVSKLSDQEFFKNAQNGDKLLVYQNAKKAILYRPSTNKIIEVSTIDLGTEQDGTAKDASKETSDSTEKKDANSENVSSDQPGLE